MKTRLLSLFVFCVGGTAFAFPEMVRHGYGNCISCHESPSGAGILTGYGRALSSEVLSMAGTETEGDFLYGIVPLPKKLYMGGDLRLLQNMQNFPTRTVYKFIPMQADFEAAVDLKDVPAVATIGAAADGTVISRRHYAMFRPSKNLTFRAGRFLPNFGIQTENHTLGIRRGLGRDQATESYNLEASWITEDWDFFATAIFGRPDAPLVGAETGAALSTSYFFDRRFKLGFSYFYGSRNVENRHIMGPFAILGFTTRFFILMEADLQILRPSVGTAVTQTGFVDTVRIDYEFIQGLHVYLMQQYGVVDLQNTAAAGQQGYGIGLQIFPRPHFEINLFYQKAKIASSSVFADLAFGLFHVYL